MSNRPSTHLWLLGLIRLAITSMLLSAIVSFLLAAARSLPAAPAAAAAIDHDARPCLSSARSSGAPCFALRSAPAAAAPPALPPVLPELPLPPDELRGLLVYRGISAGAGAGSVLEAFAARSASAPRPGTSEPSLRTHEPAVLPPSLRDAACLVSRRRLCRAHSQIAPATAPMVHAVMASDKMHTMT